MDFKRYQYILKVYEVGSITRAAAVLFISQPALSHYIAKVEDELGAPIFDRTTNPLSLTRVGEIYVDAAKQILAIDGRMKNDVQRVLKNECGKICVGMSHARASYFLPHMLLDFQKKYPDIEVVPMEGGYAQGEKSVLSGEVDFAIMPGSAITSNLSSKIILKEELKLVSNEELPHKIGRSEDEGKQFSYVDINILNGHSIIMLKKGHGLRNTLDIIFMEHGIKPNLVLETSGSEIAFRLASSGMAAAVVPESTILMTRTMREPYIYSVGENGIYWNIAAVYRDWNRLGKPQRDFIKILQNCFHKGAK